MKKCIRVVSILLAALLLLSSVSLAADGGVMPLSDSRIIQMTTSVTNPSSRTMKVTFSLDCYRDMTSLGASIITIYKKDGTIVKTFLKAQNPSMYTSNKSFYSSSVKCTVPSAGYYYAVVVCYAKDSTGTSSKTIKTKTVYIS